MADELALPFHSFSFTLISGKRPRSAFRMRAEADGMYELHVEKGSAANPVSQFTRRVPLDVALRFKDALQDIGVFGWDEAYADDPAAQPCRWTMNMVFREGVFAVSAKGGSAVPVGFQLMLEELYKLDFPRPEGAGKPDAGIAPKRDAVGLGSALNALGSMGLGSMGGMSVGDIAARNAAGAFDGADFGQMADQLGFGGMPGFDPSQIAELFGEIQGDPQAMQQRMRDEFKHLPPDEQNRMLDALASTGMASREWWRRFLQG